ncbi:MAG TPA: M20/M25/M40 family metallo-hydrolase [Pirellulales bacterium]|nr:M20/M25/M40 family metallo-hydrolase [Pirellulales bacterium]
MARRRRGTGTGAGQLVQWSAAAAVGLATLGGSAWAEHAARSNAASAITADAAKHHVEVLADDTFEGREAGSRGGRAAGLYIVKQLEADEMPGGGDKGSYYQTFGTGYSNILAVLAGSDPALKDQVIVVSAHYDHVGYGSRRNSFGPIGQIHNGADDNASGVSLLLEVVDAFHLLGQPPKRTVLFAFWDGEEKGLLGSIHWVANPTVPLDHVVLNVNADMVGRARSMRFEVSGSRTMPGLRRLFSTENDATGLGIDFPWDIKTNSDHYTFYKKQIPALLVHTGLHNDYHRPSDDVEKINSDGIRQIAQTVFHVVDELANAPTLPGFRSRSQSETLATQADAEKALSLPPSRLGVRWNPNAAPGTGVTVVSIEPGSAAAKAGLAVGDRVVRFAGAPIESPEQFRSLVLSARSPVAAQIMRAGKSEPVELTIQLAGSPTRVGITWRVDDAEPGAVILNRVLPGSAADAAGLHVNDRIYRVAGHDFANESEFRERLKEATGPLELEVESHGQVRTVKLDLPSDTPPTAAVTSEAVPAEKAADAATPASDESE